MVKEMKMADKLKLLDKAMAKAKAEYLGTVVRFNQAADMLDDNMNGIRAKIVMLHKQFDEDNAELKAFVTELGTELGDKRERLRKLGEANYLLTDKKSYDKQVGVRSKVDYEYSEEEAVEHLVKTQRLDCLMVNKTVFNKYLKIKQPKFVKRVETFTLSLAKMFKDGKVEADSKAKKQRNMEL